jgi:phosphohistidine swiveling domain-containing protein
MLALAQAHGGGAKAETLARLRAAGLPVPDGVVLLAGEEPGPELDAALARLGGDRFAVRSSSDVEDGEAGTAAGVFESVINAADVRAAIARVRDSVNSEAARAWAAARGVRSVRMAVLIQPMVKAERLGVARGAGPFTVEERRAGEPEWGDVEARVLAEDEPLAEGLRKIVALLGGAVDVEYALAGGAPIFLQARRAPVAAAQLADAMFAIAGDWRLDAEHNPAPLSAAQAGLIDRVNALGAGAQMRVLGGWLYVARDSPPGTPIPLADLPRRFREEIAPACEAMLKEGEASLPAALAAFEQVWARYVAEVSPSLRRARTQLDQLLRATLGEPLAAHGALLAGTGAPTVARDQALWELGRGTLSMEEYAARFGMYAPAWDVAVPCDDEAPERVRAQAAAIERPPLERHAAAEAEAHAAFSATLERLDRMSRRAFKALLPLVRAALPIAEEDDVLFYRAQRLVRRALLARGRELGVEEIFDLPLSLALDPGSADLHAEAARGKRAREEAARRVPPVAIDAGRPRFADPPGTVLRGFATAGRARGRAVLWRNPEEAPPPLADDAILILPALVPAASWLLPSVRAFITEHGGAHSHGATLAREYGIPAVLGVRGALQISEGETLYVDADSGRVIRT